MEISFRDAVIEGMSTALARNELDEALWNHFARVVPTLIIPCHQPVAVNVEDSKISELVLEPLEAFIAGNKLGENKFEFLKTNDILSYLCNRSFRPGEPTYSCRDCAVDATCVLCIDCFKQSGHKNHRYKISTSNGGGLCDCGDPEAWKSGYACSQHEPPEGVVPPNVDLEDARKRLPPDVAGRFEALVQHSLSYIYRMLSLRDVDPLPNYVSLLSSSDQSGGDFEYTTILYNDETHTYEQVISTLTRTLECSQAEALGYATIVDHEGRSPVKFGSFEACERIKTSVERNSRRPQPLRVDIISTTVFIHQVFALKLMKWIQNLSEVCEGFKAVICDVCLRISPASGDMSLVAALLLKDVRLWKAARNACHSLFMATFLAFNDAKIEFTRLFARLYPELMTEFISDDHDHTDSCTSLSVQLFTVPTVARTLFSDKLVEVIIRSFVLICHTRRNEQGRLSFDRSTQPVISAQFKRALYSLYDIRYLVNTVPTAEQWTESLRHGFIGAFDQFLEIMVLMEGMDGHTRRTLSHVEYETDWEPAFNLQLRMGPVMDQLQSWCASDNKVLAACTERLIVAAVNALGTMEKLEKKEVARYVFECIDYDVATQVVSIHHPVIRLLGGLVVSALVRGITLQPYDTRQFIDECLSEHARELAEYPLRTLVLVAQTSAGMWRRNGYALANQIFFYQQPRCREEMLDKDIVMLQVCAAVMKPNDFLINMLSKFGLVAWADETFDATPIRTDGDDSIRQVMYLAEEFFYCLMVFIGERYFPNVGKVTADDCLKNEIIHQLCIQTMSYSELVKNLPEQDAKASSLDEIIREVAVFKRTSPTSKGYFELKPEYATNYNMFFYHYSRIEHSKAEDTQRKRRKKENEETVFAPPCPPEFTDAFAKITDLLCCDVFIHLVNLTVRRALNHHPRSFSEGQLIRVLFLVGYGLHEEKRARDQGRSDFKFIEKAADVGIFSTLRELRKQKDSDSYRSLVEWVIQFYESITEQIVDKVEPMEVTEQASAAAQENADDNEERRRRAAARRERIMQQMKTAQTSFASQNMGELKEIALPDDPITTPSVTPIPSAVESIVALGPHRSLHRSDVDQDEKHTCILCSESHVVSLSTGPFVAVAYVQRSTVLSQENRQDFAATFQYQPPVTAKELCQKLIGNPLYVQTSIPCAPHVSSCGHLLHAGCWKVYFDSVVARERRRSIRLRTNTGGFDVTKNEFRCPLCSRLCNAAIPFFPTVIQKDNSFPLESVGSTSSLPSLNDFASGLTSLLAVSPRTWEKFTEEEMDKLDMYQQVLEIKANLGNPAKAQMAAVVHDAVTTSWRLQGIEVKNYGVVPEAHVEAIRTFQNQVYQMVLNTSSASSNEDQCVALNWSACSYSIQTIETCLRYEKKSLLGSFSSRQYLCLKSLIGATCWSSAAYEGKILSENAIKLFSLLCNPVSDVRKHVLSLDAFTLLMNCTNAFPWLPWSEEVLTAPYNDSICCRPPVGDIFDQHIFIIVYSMHIVQYLLSIVSNAPGGPATAKPAKDSDHGILGDIYLALHRRLHGEISDVSQSIPDNLEQLVKEGVWPFLRCCVIYYHFITGILAPEGLTVGGKDAVSELSDLCEYLGVPSSFSSFISSSSALRDLINRWILSVSPDPSKKPTEVRFPRPFPSFATLPQDYIDVFNRASQNNGCRKEADERRSPAICLVCGALLCSQSMCCQYKLDNQSVGSCTFHSATCGAGTGIFVRVRDNQILMLHGTNKGCFAASPYVDSYGEPDPGLRRGNPLHLSNERMEQMHRHYMHHDTADEVSHAMDQNGTLAGFDWFHF